MCQFLREGYGGRPDALVGAALPRSVSEGDCRSVSAARNSPARRIAAGHALN